MGKLDLIREARLNRERLYLIECVGSGWVKIGKSENPARRMQGLQTCCPLELVLLAELPRGTGVEELALHYKLRDFRGFGEWFRDVPEVRAAFYALRGRSAA